MLNSNDFSSSAVQVLFEEINTAIIVPQVVELLHAEATRLSELVIALQEQDVKRYVFDLSALTYISSEGLGTVASCWKWCRDEGRNGAMTVVLSSDPTNSVRNLFEIIGLSRMMGDAVLFSRSDAMAYLKNIA